MGQRGTCGGSGNPPVRPAVFRWKKPDDESEGKTYRDYLNPESKRNVRGYVEPSAALAAPEQAFQFERTGYFVADSRDHSASTPVFNRSVTLRDALGQVTAAEIQRRPLEAGVEATEGRR